jgi:hypothetical protein
MKKIIHFSARIKVLALASVFCAASGNLQAQFLDATNLKPVFKIVTTTNSAGETVTGVQASASTFSTDASGVITSKQQTEIQVSNGAGGQEKIVNQITTTATPDPVSGKYEVVTIDKKKTTPVDASGTATGAAVTVNTFTDDTDVDGDDLDLAPATTFTPVDPELDIPVVISAE